MIFVIVLIIIFGALYLIYNWSKGIINKDHGVRNYMIVVTVLAIIIAALQLFYSWSSSNSLLFWLTLPALLYAVCTAWQLLSRKGHRFVRCFPLAMLPLWMTPFVVIAGILTLASHGMEGSAETTTQEDQQRLPLRTFGFLLPGLPSCCCRYGSYATGHLCFIRYKSFLPPVHQFHGHAHSPLRSS